MNCRPPLMSDFKRTNDHHIRRRINEHEAQLKQKI